MKEVGENVRRVKRGKKQEVNGGISRVERGGGDTVTRKGEGTWVLFIGLWYNYWYSSHLKGVSLSVE